MLAEADPSAWLRRCRRRSCKSSTPRSFAERDDYPRLKRRYNELVMAWLPELRAGAGQRRADPFKLAVWMAMAGNYIDFGILKEVDDARLQAHARHAGRKGRGHAGA